MGTSRFRPFQLCSMWTLLCGLIRSDPHSLSAPGNSAWACWSCLQCTKFCLRHIGARAVQKSLPEEWGMFFVRSTTGPWWRTFSSSNIPWKGVAINTFCSFKLQHHELNCLSACFLWCLCPCTSWTSVALRQPLSCNKSCFQLTDPFSMFFCRQPVLQEVRTVPFLENHLSHCWRTEPASWNELYWWPAEESEVVDTAGLAQGFGIIWWDASVVSKAG